MFVVYKSEYNPPNLTGQVGGNISTSVLSGYINELFYHVDSLPSGVTEATQQYRKIFIKNTYTKTSTNTRVWFDAIEHEDQIYIARSTGMVDFSSNAATPPSGVSGWTTPTNYVEGINIGTLSPNAYTGVWIRQTLSGISSPDPYASFRITIGGIIT